MVWLLAYFLSKCDWKLNNVLVPVIYPALTTFQTLCEVVYPFWEP